MNSSTLMVTYVSDLTDPALRVIVDDHALPEGATPYHEHTDLVIVGLEEGAPAGFVNGVTVDDHPILENMGIRPGFRGEGRSHDLFQAFEAAIQERGQTHLLTSVNDGLDVEIRFHLRSLLWKWGLVPYAHDGVREWWMKGISQVSRKGSD